MDFILKGGRHQDERGKEYLKGDTVSSISDLTVLFRGKFEKAEENTAPDTNTETEAPAEVKVEAKVEAPVENDVSADFPGEWKSRP